VGWATPGVDVYQRKQHRMRLTLLQMDDRLETDWQMPADTRPPDSRVRVEFVNRNRVLTQARGWSHVLRTTGYHHLPPWWWKVFAIRDLFHSDPDPSSLLVLWMDTDAALTPPHGVCAHKHDASPVHRHRPRPTGRERCPEVPVDEPRRISHAKSLQRRCVPRARYRVRSTPHR
jgi:hypothetical protein